MKVLISRTSCQQPQIGEILVSTVCTLSFTYECNTEFHMLHWSVRMYAKEREKRVSVRHRRANQVYIGETHPWVSKINRPFYSSSKM